MKTLLIAPEKLSPNPWNTNRVSSENMKKLATSIRQLGFVSAVVVRELEDGTLQILGGQHRAQTAVDMGLKSIPVLNLGVIPDDRAKKIGLVDNSRYGTDDSIGLAKLIDELGISSLELAEFLPFSEKDFSDISAAVDIDVDSIGFEDDNKEDDKDPKTPLSKPMKSHDYVRFRVSLSDSERIRQLIEETIRDQGFKEDDELTAAGLALSYLLLNSGS